VVASAGMNILISGWGSIGQRHATNLENMGHRVLSFDPDVRPRPIGGVQSYSDGLKMASHVLIASPAKFHAPQAIKALEAGKEVFIEKPMAMDVKEGEAIMAAAEAAGKTVAVGYNWHAYKPLQYMRDFVKHFLLPAYIELTYSGDKITWPGQCYDDLLLECSHELSALRWLTTLPVSVISAEVDSQKATLCYQGPDFEAVINLDWGSKYNFRSWKVLGRDFEVLWKFDYSNEIARMLLDDSYRDEISAWISGKSICTGEAGLAVLRDIERIRELAAK